MIRLIFTFPMLVAVVAAVASAIPAGNATPPPKEATVMKVHGRTVWVSSAVHPAKTTCSGSNRAINFYRRAVRSSRERMWQAGDLPQRRWWGCDSARRRATEWREKAHQAREALDEWNEYQFDWQKWLPRGWYGVGSCETGYGGEPNWHHNSGSYQGAFGFAVTSWDNFTGSADPKAGPYPSEAYLATPRQQYEVALAIYRRYGLSGWGCREAFYR